MLIANRRGFCGREVLFIIPILGPSGRSFVRSIDQFVCALCLCRCNRRISLIYSIVLTRQLKQRRRTEFSARE